MNADTWFRITIWLTAAAIVAWVVAIVLQILVLVLQ
jgi:hypothetical protein